MAQSSSAPALADPRGILLNSLEAYASCNKAARPHYCYNGLLAHGSTFGVFVSCLSKLSHGLSLVVSLFIAVTS